MSWRRGRSTTGADCRDGAQQAAVRISYPHRELVGRPDLHGAAGRQVGHSVGVDVRDDHRRPVVERAVDEGATVVVDGERGRFRRRGGLEFLRQLGDEPARDPQRDGRPGDGEPGRELGLDRDEVAVDQRIGPRGQAHDRKRWLRRRRQDFVAPVTPTEDASAVHVVGQGRREVGERRVARRRQCRDVQPPRARAHPSVRLRGRVTRRDDRATDAFGDEVDVEHGVGADHVDVAVEALQLVVEVVRRRAARGEDLADHVAATPHDVGEREAKLLLGRQIEVDRAVGVRLDSRRDVAQERFREVDLDAEVREPNLGRHPVALGSLRAELDPVEDERPRRARAPASRHRPQGSRR